MNVTQNISHKAALLGLAALAALGAGGRAARADTVTMYDYPGSSDTHGLGINDSGSAVGLYTDPGGATKGYLRLPDGTFTAIIDPSDNSSYTRAWGINNAGTIVGDYLNNTGGTSTYHGFLLRGGVYTTFDISGPYSTDIFAVNNNGDFGGIYGSSAYANRAFLDIGGVITTFTGPAGSTNTVVQGLNTSNVAVGTYTDSAGTTHGFSRDPATGTLTTIDPPGSIYTLANGINDQGTIVGAYQDVNTRFTDFLTAPASSRRLTCRAQRPPRSAGSTMPASSLAIISRQFQQSAWLY